jgi:predicted DNA binding CopG/RHH family protein
MGKRNGQVLLSTMVSARQATVFRALAQAADLGVSAALRQMIAQRVEATEGQGEDLLRTDVAVGHSKRINVRLRDSELAILTQAAKNAGTPIANLIRSIVFNLNP